MILQSCPYAVRIFILFSYLHLIHQSDCADPDIFSHEMKSMDGDYVNTYFNIKDGKNFVNVKLQTETWSSCPRIIFKTSEGLTKRDDPNLQIFICPAESGIAISHQSEIVNRVEMKELAGNQFHKFWFQINVNDSSIEFGKRDYHLGHLIKKDTTIIRYNFLHNFNSPSYFTYFGLLNPGEWVLESENPYLVLDALRVENDALMHETTRFPVHSDQIYFVLKYITDKSATWLDTVFWGEENEMLFYIGIRGDGRHVRDLYGPLHYSGDDLVQANGVARFWMKFDRPLRSLSFGSYRNDTPITTLVQSKINDINSVEAFSMRAAGKATPHVRVAITKHPNIDDIDI